MVKPIPAGKKGKGLRALKKKAPKSLKQWAIKKAAKQKGENNEKRLSQN